MKILFSCLLLYVAFSQFPRNLFSIQLVEKCTTITMHLHWLGQESSVLRKLVSLTGNKTGMGNRSQFMVFGLPAKTWLIWAVLKIMVWILIATDLIISIKMCSAVHNWQISTNTGHSMVARLISGLMSGINMAHAFWKYSKKTTHPHFLKNSCLRNILPLLSIK